MAIILLKISVNKHSDIFYDNIAWKGLKGTAAWNQLTQSQKDTLSLEYEIMASRYIPIIVKGLKEVFNNNNLTDDEYRALAWQGLSNTDIYRDAPPEFKTKIHENTQPAKSKSSKTCKE